jgi:hypothetical protein
MITNKILNRLCYLFISGTIHTFIFASLMLAWLPMLQPNRFYSMLILAFSLITTIIVLSPWDTKLDNWFRRRFNKRLRKYIRGGLIRDSFLQDVFYDALKLKEL